MTRMDPETRREEEELAKLLRVLDHEPPGIDLAALERKARRGKPASGWIAASVTLLIAAGALAYAIPGSPVRSWIEAAIGERQPEVGEPEAPQNLSGVALVPEGPIDVVFADPGLYAQLHDYPIVIQRVASDTLTLRVVGWPAAIESDEGRLVVTGGGPTSRFEVLVPRFADRVRILFRGDPVWVQSGGTVVSRAEEAEPGRYLLQP